MESLVSVPSSHPFRLVPPRRISVCGRSNAYLHSHRQFPDRSVPQGPARIILARSVPSIMLRGCLRHFCLQNSGIWGLPRPSPPPGVIRVGKGGGNSTPSRIGRDFLIHVPTPGFAGLSFHHSKAPRESPGSFPPVGSMHLSFFMCPPSSFTGNRIFIFKVRRPIRKTYTRDFSQKVAGA